MGVSFFCNFFLLCLGIGLLSRAELSLPDLSWGVPYLKPAFTLVITTIQFETVGTSQRCNIQGPNRRPNRLVITGPQKQEATFGVRGAGFVTFFFFFFLIGWW